MSRRPASAARLAAAAATTIALIASGAVLAAPASALERPYVLGNTVTEPDPEITVSRIGVSDADGANLAWLAPAAVNTHHADASLGGRTLAFLRGPNTISGGSHVVATLIVRRDGANIFSRTGLVGPPDVSSDGRWVVFTQGRAVFRYAVLTRVLTRIWRAPVGEEAETVGASADRTRLLVMSQRMSSPFTWHLRLIRRADGAVLRHLAGGVGDLYERPEWSPTSRSALVIWHGAAAAPRAIRVDRAGGLHATALGYPLRSFNWRADGIYALDPLANTVMRTALAGVAPVLAWNRAAPGNVLDSIVLLDARPH